MSWPAKPQARHGLKTPRTKTALLAKAFWIRSAAHHNLSVSLTAFERRYQVQCNDAGFAIPRPFQAITAFEHPQTRQPSRPRQSGPSPSQPGRAPMSWPAKQQARQETPRTKTALLTKAVWIRLATHKNLSVSLTAFERRYADTIGQLQQVRRNDARFANQRPFQAITAFDRALKADPNSQAARGNLAKARTSLRGRNR